MSIVALLIVTLLRNMVTLMMAVVFGAIAYLTLPLFASVVSKQYGLAAARQYVSLGMTALGRGLLVKSSQGGGYTLKKTAVDYSLPLPAEVCKMDGESKAWIDPDNYMGTLAGRPFGLAHEDKNVILDAQTAWAGGEFIRLKQAGEWMVNGHRKAYFEVPETRVLTNLDDALPIIQGSADPGLASRVKSFTEKANMLFNTSRTSEYITLLMALGAGMGLVFLASRVKTTAGGGTTITFDTTTAVDVATSGVLA